MDADGPGLPTGLAAIVASLSFAANRSVNPLSLAVLGSAGSVDLRINPTGVEISSHLYRTIKKAGICGGKSSTTSLLGNELVESSSISVLPVNGRILRGGGGNPTSLSYHVLTHLRPYLELLNNRLVACATVRSGIISLSSTLMSGVYCS